MFVHRSCLTRWFASHGCNQPSHLLAMFVCAYSFFIQFHRRNNSQSFDMNSIFHLSIVIISGSYSTNIVFFASTPWTHSVYEPFAMFISLTAFVCVFAKLLGLHKFSISSNGISSSWNSFTLSAFYVISMAIIGNKITNFCSNKTSNLMASFCFGVSVWTLYNSKSTQVKRKKNKSF